MGKNCNKIFSNLTLCLSMCKGLKFGSNSKRCGSKLTGDWRLPLLHNDHSGFMSPQNAGPAKKINNRQNVLKNRHHTLHIKFKQCRYAG